MSSGYRPLGYAIEILESVGLKVSHNYDDLVFVENNTLIVQFNDKNDKELFLFFNKDLEAKVAKGFEDVLIKSAKDKGFKMVLSGTYEISQDDESKEELQIKFFNK